MKGHCGTCTFTGQGVSEMTRTQLYNQGKWEFSEKSEGLITILERALTGHLIHIIRP